MKKAILVVSCGTSYKETRQKSIEACEDKIRGTFRSYDFFRSYTSDKIINKIKKDEGIIINEPKEALQRLYELRYEEVVVQSLHMICGNEFEKLKEEVEEYNDKFKRITLGRPLLTHSEDYKEVANILKQKLPKLNKDEAVILIGHGTNHVAQESYKKLEEILQKEYIRIYIGTTIEPNTLQEILPKLKMTHIKTVYLVPLLLVLGKHAISDIWSDDEGTWKTVLRQAGYNVEMRLKGLGEYEEIQKCFAKHAKESLHRK